MALLLPNTALNPSPLRSVAVASKAVPSLAKNARSARVNAWPLGSMNTVPEGKTNAPVYMGS